MAKSFKMAMISNKHVNHNIRVTIQGSSELNRQISQNYSTEICSFLKEEYNYYNYELYTLEMVEERHPRPTETESWTSWLL